MEPRRINQVVLTVVPYGVISLLVILSYLPTFSGGFILDDRPLVKNNPYITKPQSVMSYLSQEDGITEQAYSGASHTGYYRPLVNLTYWIDYELWGVLASGFRTTNLILHLLNCFVLYQLIILLAGDRKVAFLITLLFSVHPANTEAVAWITSRNNILVSIFCLSSLYWYVLGWKKEKYGYLLLSAALFALGVFSKEFGLMLVPILLLYHRVFPEKNGRICKELRSYVPFILILAVYFALRILATGSLVSPSRAVDLWQRIYFSPYIIMMNLRFFFFPYGLHSFIVDYPGSYLNWQALAGFACLGLYGFLLWRNREKKVLVFGSVSFLVTLFPVLNVVDTSAITLISMRWLYFPVSFLLLSLSCCLKRVLSTRPSVALPVAGMIVMYFGTYSYVLNKELWHDEDTFFQQEVLHFNNSFYLGGLAENLLERGRHREAEFYFQKAICQLPHEAKNYINYSALLVDTGRFADALACLTRAGSLTMTRQESAQRYNNLGMAFFGLKRQDDALRSFRKAVILHPEEARFWSNLGAAYGSLGDYENSISTLKKGMDIVSDPISLKENLAVSYIRILDYERALVILESIPIQERERNKRVSELLSQARQGLSPSARKENAFLQTEGGAVIGGFFH